MTSEHLRRLVHGVKGVGRVVPGKQPFLISSEGLCLSETKGYWHLELSPLKHCFLKRFGNSFKLVIKEFKYFEKERGKILHPTAAYVQMNEQQCADLVFGLIDLIPTARRHDILAWTDLELKAIEDEESEDEDGMVGTISEEDMARQVTFTNIPPLNLDLHLGDMLFAHARGRFRAIELTHYCKATYKELQSLTPRGSPPVSKAITAQRERGLQLLQNEWESLCSGLTKLPERWRGLAHLTPCAMNHTDDQWDMLDCEHCSPYGEIITQPPQVELDRRPPVPITDRYASMPVLRRANETTHQNFGIGVVYGDRAFALFRHFSYFQERKLSSALSAVFGMWDAPIKTLVADCDTVFGCIAECLREEEEAGEEEEEEEEAGEEEREKEHAILHTDLLLLKSNDAKEASSNVILIDEQYDTISGGEEGEKEEEEEESDEDSDTAILLQAAQEAEESVYRAEREQVNAGKISSAHAAHAVEAVMPEQEGLSPFLQGKENDASAAAAKILPKRAMVSLAKHAKTTFNSEKAKVNHKMPAINRTHFQKLGLQQPSGGQLKAARPSNLSTSKPTSTTAANKKVVTLPPIKTSGNNSKRKAPESVNIQTPARTKKFRSILPKPVNYQDNQTAQSTKPNLVIPGAPYKPGGGTMARVPLLEQAMDLSKKNSLARQIFAPRRKDLALNARKAPPSSSTYEPRMSTWTSRPLAK